MAKYREIDETVDDKHPPASETPCARGRPPGNSAATRSWLEGLQVPAGWETIRSAHCPEHGKATSNFIGVNEHGWIFRCSGPVKPKVIYAQPHAFIARPAAPKRKTGAAQ